MAEQSQLWTTNGTGDGTSGGYSINDWIDILSKLINPGQLAVGGVIYGEGNNLSASGAASPITVDTGAAIAYGFLYENTTPVPLAVTTPTVGTTGGHIVLRVNWAAQTVRLRLERSANGVATPPALVQTAGTTWDIRLWTFQITTAGVITLTDARTFARGPSNAPHVIGRQGYNSTSWAEHLGGSLTNYFPGIVGVQSGMVRWTGAAIDRASVVVTFPKTFTGSPLVQVTVISTSAKVCTAVVPSATGDSVTIYWRTFDGSTATTMDLAWAAFGPTT